MHTKSESRHIRRLADIAWERQLRDALNVVGGVISEMASGKLSPFDANMAVHQFHNGIARELFFTYSRGNPWDAVCRALYEGVLTEDDLVNVSDKVRTEMKQYADCFQEYEGIRSPPTTDSGD